MSISISQKDCRGCGACVEVCPGNLIKLAQKKAFITHPRDCWGCTSCIKACSFKAIRFFLGADIGGHGAILTVTTKGPLRTWHVQLPDGTAQDIVINANESNKY